METKRQKMPFWKRKAKHNVTKAAFLLLLGKLSKNNFISEEDIAEIMKLL